MKHISYDYAGRAAYGMRLRQQAFISTTIMMSMLSTKNAHGGEQRTTFCTPHRPNDKTCRQWLRAISTLNMPKQISEKKNESGPSTERKSYRTATYQLELGIQPACLWTSRSCCFLLPVLFYFFVLHRILLDR